MQAFQLRRRHPGACGARRQPAWPTCAACHYGAWCRCAGATHSVTAEGEKRRPGAATGRTSLRRVCTLSCVLSLRARGGPGDAAGYMCRCVGAVSAQRLQPGEVCVGNCAPVATTITTATTLSSQLTFPEPKTLDGARVIRSRLPLSVPSSVSPRTLPTSPLTVVLGTWPVVQPLPFLSEQPDRAAGSFSASTTSFFSKEIDTYSNMRYPS